MENWESYVRKVVPYVPGEQPQAERMIKLKCKECGGVMTADSSNKTLHCPIC